jgi:archaellum component FlaC
MDTDRYKEALERELALLAQMRDELKVQMHLAKADAKDEWNRLEKKLETVQSELRTLGEDAKAPLREVQSASRALLDELKKGYERVRAQLSS